MRTANRAAHARRRYPYLKRTAVVTVGVLAVAGLGMQSASAAVTVTAATQDAITVGSADVLTVTLKADGNGGSVSQINVLPSCGSAMANPLSTNGCLTPELGVFSLAAAPGGTCTGTLSIGAALPNGVVPISINAPHVFAGAGECTINLTRAALRVPTVDVSGNPGVQTNHAVSAIVNGTETPAALDFTTVSPNPNPGPNQPPAPAAGTCNGLATTLSGGSGNQDIVGTPGNDVVNLGSGNDSFVGNGGNDVVCGGSGNDEITTGDGNDTIFAGSGDDDVDAGGGQNTVDFGSGEL